MGYDGSRVRLENTLCPKLYISNVCIDVVHKKKYLGVVLDSHLTFHKHLNNIIKITAHKINLSAKMRQYLTEFSSITIYKTMILPYFDYGHLLFINSQKQLLARQIRSTSEKSFENLPEIRRKHPGKYPIRK